MESNRTLTLPLNRLSHSTTLLGRSAHALLRGAVERIVPLERINQIYTRAAEPDGPGTFFDKALAALSVTVAVSDADLERIPRTGGVVVVANHPYGAIEGIAMLSMLARVRQDVRVLANQMLGYIPQMADHSFFVDPFGNKTSARSNVRGVVQAIRWLEGGGVLVVFPAGEVSHVQLRERAVCDPEWNESVARIIRSAKVQVLPVFFHGRNTMLFQAAGLLHPRLRTVLLPRELLRARNASIRTEIGTGIPFSRLSAMDDAAMMRYLRERTYLLEHRSIGCDERRSGAEGLPIAQPEPPAVVEAELCGLPACGQLVEHDDFAVVFASAGQIPAALRELGRLRETAFRAAGEGTGAERDIDRYDEHYHHLILWNRASRQIVGSYRIGRVDSICREHGVHGLYTRSLFHYGGKLIEQLGPALELGRSFIHPDFQRSYLPLMLLWRGIGEYLVRHPRYHILFGAVSISDEYTSTSQRIMSAFLRHHTYDHSLGMLVRPKSAPVVRRRSLEGQLPRLVTSFEDVSVLVRELERDARGVPVLLRQYLKLGGRLLGLNVDRSFSNVLDALIYVDLLAAERPLLERYMGQSGMAAYLAAQNAEG